MSTENGLWRTDGTRVFFPDNTGGFDLIGCPAPVEKAREIVAAVNACNGIALPYLEKFSCTTFNDFKRVKDQRDKLRSALQVVLDQVDYTRGACSLTEMVGACLDASVIDMARDVLKETA